MRYTEIFREGSFKHYGKIRDMFKLSIDIELINIEEWAQDCLDRVVGHFDSCC